MFCRARSSSLLFRYLRQKTMANTEKTTPPDGIEMPMAILRLLIDLPGVGPGIDGVSVVVVIDVNGLVEFGLIDAVWTMDMGDVLPRRVLLRVLEDGKLAVRENSSVSYKPR